MRLNKFFFLLIALKLCSVLSRSVDNIVDTECQSLPATLKDEIRSYEGIATQIIKEVVEGKFSGVTYNR